MGPKERGEKEMPELKPIPDEEKGFKCEVLLDSINEANEVRLITVRQKYPLIVHAEKKRHRSESSSVASNRAIPTWRILQMLEEDPFVPEHWGANQSGMQAAGELSGPAREYAIRLWGNHRAFSAETARQLSLDMEALYGSSLHKQIANRLMMPHQWVTEIVSFTDVANYLNLRCHPAAEPHMRKVAEMQREAIFASTPKVLKPGQWHLPLLREGEAEQFDEMGAKTLSAWRLGGYEEDRFVQSFERLAHLPVEWGKRWLTKAVSAARVARTSYRTHEGKEATLAEDLDLYLRLVGQVPRHMSPTEHVACALPSHWQRIATWDCSGPTPEITSSRCEQARHGNFRGWWQHRMDFKDQNLTTYEWEGKTIKEG
jgi:thymidylate synthase ThyX